MSTWAQQAAQLSTWAENIIIIAYSGQLILLFKSHGLLQTCCETKESWRQGQENYPMLISGSGWTFCPSCACIESQLCQPIVHHCLSIRTHHCLHHCTSFSLFKFRSFQSVPWEHVSWKVITISKASSQMWIVKKPQAAPNLFTQGC